MKRILFIQVVLFLSFTLRAQNSLGILFKDPVYTNYFVTQNLLYGTNADFVGDSIQLTMDVYEPSATQAIKRPLIIFAHSGGFTGGDKGEDDIVLLCSRLAERGYVTASINYRQGMKPPDDTTQFVTAFYRATQDGRAAVRYLKANASLFCIDSNYVFFGGPSAGGVTSLHVTFWTQDEIPPYVDTAALGPLEHADNSYTNSSAINGVVNCWGAVVDSNIFNARPHIPVMSFVGAEDPAIPPYEGYYNAPGNKEIHVFGSIFIDGKLARLDDVHQLKIFQNTEHGFLTISPKWDTVVNMTADFLYNNFLQEYVPQGCGEPAAPLITPTVWFRGSELLIDNDQPTPIQETLIYNTSGQLVMDDLSTVSPYQIYSLPNIHLASGLYLARFILKSGQQEVQKLEVIN